jgi:DNA-directed RNA polymerase omega subunit
MVDHHDANGPADPVSATDEAPSLITSRFLFVDVAAQRAKQLRRGALPRLSSEVDSARPEMPIKPERIAMEEVRRGLVHYEVPAPKPPSGSPR